MPMTVIPGANGVKALSKQLKLKYRAYSNFFYAVNRSTHSKNSAGNGLKNLNHELGVLFFPTVNERTNSRGFAGLMIKCIVEKIANATITVGRNINKRARLCLLESGRLALSSKEK